MAMFTSNFTETENKKVEMHGKALKDIQLLLNCIYPPNPLLVTGMYLGALGSGQKVSLGLQASNTL